MKSLQQAERIALLEENLTSFWQAGEELNSFVVKPGKPEIDKAVLKRLGDAPFKVGGQNLAALLAKEYDAVTAVVDRKTSDNEEV